MDLHHAEEVPDNLLGIIPNDDDTPAVDKQKKKSHTDAQLDENNDQPSAQKKKKHDSLYQLQLHR